MRMGSIVESLFGSFRVDVENGVVLLFEVGF